MKGLVYGLIFFSMLTLSGCSSISNGINDKPNISIEDQSIYQGTEDIKSVEDRNITDKSSYTIKDYYPFKENVKYSYEGKGIEFASYVTYVDYIKGDKIQIRSNNGGTEVVRVIQNKDGELKVVYSQEESYYREDFTGKPFNKNEILLKEPLVKGTSWILEDGRRRYISNVDVVIDTPSGSYKTLEVTTENNDGSTMEYYALNVGLVKTVTKTKDMEVTSTLSKIDDKARLEQTIKFYYPDVNKDIIYYVDKKLYFNTNDITKMSIERALKELPNQEVGKLLGTNAKIKSMYLSKNNIVYIDFSKEFVKEMNAGAGYEAMILKCITNTIGGYYGVNKVYITVENQPYSSGHIVMGKGEYFTVDTGATVEIKK